MTHLYLEEEHHIFRDALRKFLQKEAVPHYEQWEQDRMIPREFWHKMGEQGFLCATLDEKYGGLNADFVYTVILNEELERVGGGLGGIGLHNDVCVPYLNNYGTEEQKLKWLPKCATGEIIMSVAMTEPGAGSDLANIKMTAVHDGDHYIINGEKTFITNGIQSDLIILACKTDPSAVPGHKGISLILVEPDAPGFSRGKKLNKMGLFAQDTAELIFEDAHVPVENLLGEEGKGFSYLMSKLQQERLVCSIQAVVAAEEMLKMTLDYVKTRKAFGKSISQFQNTQFKMAEMATDIEICRTFIDNLIANHIAGKELVTQVSMAKWRTTHLAKQVASECLQLHGGYGYMEEYPISRRFRDIQVTSIYAGTNEIMKQIIAKKLEL